MNYDVEYELFNFTLKEILMILSVTLTEREFEFMAFRLGLLIDRKFSEKELQTNYLELQKQRIIIPHSFQEIALRYGYTLVRTKAIATKIDRKILNTLRHNKIRSAKLKAFLE